MDIDNHSIEHDELLGVEALEDIIDVENEMGFGEGEDWSHDDTSIGYGKLAANYKRALNKASAPHSRRRNSPPGIPPHRPRRTLAVAQHGTKHGASSSSDGDERVTRMHALTRSGMKHSSSSSSSDGVGKLKTKDEAFDNTNDVLGMFESNEVHINHSMCSSQDEEAMQDLHMDSNINGDTDVFTADANKTNVDRREKDTEILVKPNESGSSKEHAQKDAKKGTGKREEKVASSNRVRFSLDLETTEKTTGNANKRGSDGKEKAKCIKQQEWRYVRSTPGDSTGFGTPKASAVAPVRATSTQRRKELAVADSLKDSGAEFDLERAIEMRDDKKAARLAQERLERFEDSLVKQQEIVANMRLSLANEGVKDHTKLRQLVDALDRNIRKVAASSRVHQIPQSYELKNRAEQISRLKAQCNLLETDRERLKKKLRHLQNAEGNEREQDMKTKESDPDTSANERENLLEQKVRGLENSLAEWESKFKKTEADFAMERGLLEDSLSVCKLDWRNKQQRWVVKMKEREAELLQMKASQDKLVDSLVSCRQCMDKLRKEVAACNVNFTLHGKSTASEAENGCVEEKNALNLAYSIQNDMESFRRLLAESMLALQREAKLQPEVLQQESKMLENKVAQTISMMTELKQEMKSKEDHIKQENEKYAQVVADKVKHVEALEEQLADKEHDMEGFMQELKDKVTLLNKELEHERNERAHLADMQGNMKYKLLKGLRKKEQKLEEEMEGMKEKMEDMSASMSQKDERISSLEDEVKVKSAQLVHEKQKWNMAIKEVKQKAAKTILRFMHGKENGLLEHLRERRKGQKASECHAGIACKTDDEEEYQEGVSNSSSKEKLRAKRHYERAMSREPESPRESHHLLPKRRENVAVQEDLRSSCELHRDKGKLDCDSFTRKDDYCSQEFHPRELKSAGKQRTTERRDVLKLLDRRRGNVDNTFTILQDTMNGL